MRSAFAGVESRCSVSSIAAYSSAARSTTVPVPLRVIVIGSRSRVAESIKPASRFLASVKETTVNQREKPPLPQNFISLGVFRFAPGKAAVVTIGGKAANGNVHADAVQLLPQP